jgi:hypothetical protein
MHELPLVFYFFTKMAADSRGTAVLCMPRQWQDRETSPERNKIWFEPKSKAAEQKVPVVYYLSRNGQLEHPHFMEVPLSSPKGLYLRGTNNHKLHIYMNA